MTLTIEQIKHQKESYLKDIALYQAIERLGKNKDFKKVFGEEFFINECARMARMSGSLTLSKEEREDSLNKAQAAGHVMEWLHAKTMIGMRAVKNMEELDNLEDESFIDNGEI